MTRTDLSRARIVADTLRFLADGWVGHPCRTCDATPDDQKWLRETADQIEREKHDWTPCCPLCAEVTCDNGCPLRPAREDR